jgi:hypothetical protein
MGLTEMEIAAGFHEPPRQINMTIPIKLETFNKLYEKCVLNGLDLRTTIAEIIERSI